MIERQILGQRIIGPQGGVDFWPTVRPAGERQVLAVLDQHVLVPAPRVGLGRGHEGRQIVRVAATATVEDGHQKGNEEDQNDEVEEAVAEPLGIHNGPPSLGQRATRVEGVR